MTPGERLLLLLARGTFDGELAARARALIIGESVDWARLSSMSDEHGVAPLVARNLCHLGPGVPDEARSAFEAARRWNAARCLLAQCALGRVVASLGEAGVPVIPLKGVALAESLYGDAALRVSADIDVLIPRGDLARAFGALARLGYRRAAIEPELGPGDLELLAESNIEYGFLDPELPSCPVEVHWDIAWRWWADASAIADLWAEARPGRVAGVPALALSAEWELLYLSVHAARHRWHALKWIVDVHEVCLRGGLDWEAARERARRFGLAEVLGITLAICRELLETPLPGDVATRPVPRWLRLFPAADGPPDMWRDAAYPARLFRPTAEKISYLARVLFRPTLAERRLVRLPSRLAVLYYPLRPLRLGGKWALGRLRRASGRPREEPWSGEAS